MLRLCSDFLKAADTRRVTLVSLLDVSAAFDCVDHSILMQRRSTVDIGMAGVVLDWIKSFLCATVLIIIIIIIIYCITQTNIIQQYKKYRYMQMVQAKS